MTEASLKKIHFFLNFIAAVELILIVALGIFWLIVAVFDPPWTQKLYDQIVKQNIFTCQGKGIPKFWCINAVRQLLPHFP